jgi:hypothetical protein
MQAEPMPNVGGGSSTTIELCMESCSANPDCQFYSFAKNDNVCKLYSKPIMECTGYLGIPKIKNIPECKMYSGKNVY